MFGPLSVTKDVNFLYLDSDVTKLLISIHTSNRKNNVYIRKIRSVDGTFH